MRSTILLNFLVLCNLCLLVTSFPGHNAMTKKEIGDAFRTKVERAQATLDEVFRNVKHLEGPERRDFWSDAWNDVKTFWDQNKEQIIPVVTKYVLDMIKRDEGDTQRPSGGALE